MRQPRPDASFRRLDSPDDDEQGPARPPFDEGTLEFEDDRGLIEVGPTHVARSSSNWRREGYVSLPLHSLSSITFRYVAPVWWLIVGIPLLLAAGVMWLRVLTPAFSLYNPEVTATIVGTMVGLLCVAIYFLRRQQVLVLASPTGRIVLRRRGANTGELKEFAEQIEDRQRTFLRTIRLA